MPFTRYWSIKRSPTILIISTVRSILFCAKKSIAHPFYIALMVWELFKTRDASTAPQNVNWKTATLVGTKVYVLSQSQWPEEENILLYSLDLGMYLF